MAYKIVACDPSTKALAFCCYESATRSYRYGKVLRGERRLEHDVMAIIKALRGVEGVDEQAPTPASSQCPRHFVCEDQYLHLNVKTLIRIVSVRAVAEAVAAMDGYIVSDPVQPTSWQTALLNISKPRAECKRRAKEVASMIVKKKITDSDVADAICLCEFWKNRHDTKQRLDHGETGPRPAD
jgi:Holliday junction resolvasome RuvABC endonuclease subunit